MTTDATGNNQSVQTHKLGVDGKDASFTIDSKQILSNLKAKASMTAGATFTINVKVGGKSIAVTVTASVAVATGGAIDFGSLSFSCSATSVELTDAAGNKYKFEISGSGDTLTFQKAGSQAQVDFDANLEVTYDLGDDVAKGNGDNSVENCYTQNVQVGVSKKNDQLAHADFKLTDSMVNSLLNGGTLNIGSAKVTFDANSKTTAANKVGVKDLLNSKGKLDTSDDKVMKELVTRISRAASGS